MTLILKFERFGFGTTTTLSELKANMLQAIRRYTGDDTIDYAPAPSSTDDVGSEGGRQVDGSSESSVTEKSNKLPANYYQPGMDWYLPYCRFVSAVNNGMLTVADLQLSDAQIWLLIQHISDISSISQDFDNVKDALTDAIEALTNDERSESSQSHSVQDNEETRSVVRELMSSEDSEEYSSSSRYSREEQSVSGEEDDESMYDSDSTLEEDDSLMQSSEEFQPYFYL